MIIYVLLLLLLLPLAVTQTTVSPPGKDPLLPRVEMDLGSQAIRFWKSLQFAKDTRLPYDVDACYGWIGKDKPKMGQYIGLALTPNCFIVKDDLLTFLNTFQQATNEYDRFSQDTHTYRSRCTHHHLFITRLHRLDEGGLFTYHYTRVRMKGNKVEVTFLALKDVLDVGSYYQASSSVYEHPSVKFYTADEFPSSFVPLAVYSIDFEINVWFKSKEGLRLYNYRLTWDSSSNDNGYHVDVYQQSAIPNVIIPEDRISYVTTSDLQTHYFFVQTAIDNEYNVYVLKHTDLIKNDFSRLELLETKMPVDVYPRNIVGQVMTYYSLGVYRKSVRFNKLCTFGTHVEFYKNQTVGKNNETLDDIPAITDPPLANNIFATHYRSAYPFVQNGRKMQLPNYWSLVKVITLVMLAMFVAGIVVLGYGILPITIARKITLLLSKRRKFFFKSLASRKQSQYRVVFKILYRLEKLIRSTVKKIFIVFKWFASIESSEEEEELRQYLAASHDQPSNREASTPNE